MYQGSHWRRGFPQYNACGTFGGLVQITSSFVFRYPVHSTGPGLLYILWYPSWIWERCFSTPLLNTRCEHWCGLVEKWFYVLHNGFAPTYLFSFIGYLGPSRILPLPTQGYLNLVVQLQWLRLRWRASLQESLDGKQGKESWEMVLSCTPGHLRFEL